MDDDDDMEDGIMDDAGMNDDGMDEGVIHHQYPFKREMISCLSSWKNYVSIYLTKEKGKNKRNSLHDDRTRCDHAMQSLAWCTETYTRTKRT